MNKLINNQLYVAKFTPNVIFMKKSLAPKVEILSGWVQRFSAPRTALVVDQKYKEKLKKTSLKMPFQVKLVSQIRRI